MQEGWVKHFVDGTRVVGVDELVAQGKASWTKSRNKGIERVCLRWNNCFVQIRGIGEYWQSDDFIASASSGKKQCIRRRIERLAQDGDIGYQVVQTSKGINVDFIQNLKYDTRNIKVISPNQMGRWLVLEIDSLLKTTGLYWSPIRV